MVSEVRVSGEFVETFSTWTVETRRFNGDPIEVRVPVSGTEAICGRTLSRAQYQCLVVTGELANGSRVKMIAQIPDGRVSREITVELP